MGLEYRTAPTRSTPEDGDRPVRRERPEAEPPELADRGSRARPGEARGAVDAPVDGDVANPEPVEQARLRPSTAHEGAKRARDRVCPPWREGGVAAWSRASHLQVVGEVDAAE